MHKKDLSLRAAHKRKLAIELRKAERQLKADIMPLEVEKQLLLASTCDSFSGFLLRLNEEVNHAERRYLDIYGPGPIDWLMPWSVRRLAEKHIKRAFEKARWRLASTRARYELLPSEQRWDFISQWVANHHFESPELSALLSNLTAGLDGLHGQVENLLRTHTERVDAFTSKLESKLAAKLEKLYAVTQARLQPLLLQVQERRAEMIKLGEAAGVSFAS
jgi:hypothetical protein